MIVDIQVSELAESADTPEPDSIIAWAHWASGELDSSHPALSDDTQLSVQLLSDTEMAEINGEYRGKPKPTNVLSFPFEPMPGVELPLLGDMAICASVIRDEAAEQGKSLADHWAHIMIHGVLHLRGYDHIEEQDALVMEGIERQILADHGIGNPYE